MLSFWCCSTVYIQVRERATRNSFGGIVCRHPRVDEGPARREALVYTITHLDHHDRGLSCLIPATQQVVGAAFAGVGHSGSRAPPRPALSAALFATCLASQSSDAVAVLHLLNMHGDGIEDVRDENGRTPLHHVCRADDVGLVRLLCQAGADAAAKDCRVRPG